MRLWATASDTPELQRLVAARCRLCAGGHPLHGVRLQPGGIGECRPLKLQIGIQRQALRGDGLGPYCSLVRVGQRLIAQAESVLRLGRRAVHGNLLLAQDLQRIGCQHDIEVALRCAEHQSLLDLLPLEIGHIGRRHDLFALSVMLAADERQAGRQCPAPERAAVD